MFDDVTRMAPKGLDEVECAPMRLKTERGIPQDRLFKLARCCARWREHGAARPARLLRQAKGAPAMRAGSGRPTMALGLGKGECGSGVIAIVNSRTGTQRCLTGRYLSQSQGRERRCKRPPMLCI